MKNPITFSFLILILCFQGNLFAQVTEKLHHMSLGNNNAFHFDIESQDVKSIEKVWKKYFKEYGKTKKNKNIREWYSAKPVGIPASGPKKYDVYFKITKGTDILNAYMWVYDGESFVSTETHGGDGAKILAMFEGFAHRTEVYVVEKMLEKESKTLKKLEKQLGKLERNNEKYHNKIEKAKKLIIDNEAKIEQNNLEQKEKIETIDVQRKRVQKITANLNNLG